jgi:hypothetical protein
LEHILAKSSIDALFYLEKETLTQEVDSLEHSFTLPPPEDLIWSVDKSSKDAIFSENLRRVELSDLNYNFHTIHVDHEY